MQAMHSISIDEGIDSDGSACFFIKLQGSDCELNVTATARELDELLAVGNSQWSDRGSLRVGRCLGAPVFWSFEGGHLSVLVGPDDETWEVGYWAPQSLVAVLFEEIDRVRAG